MVGDTNTDIQFGQRLGMYTVLVESKELVKESPDLRIAQLAHLSQYL
jgi:phosphoglycolate phosphatase-like HAD superfamily hydrolase